MDKSRRSFLKGMACAGVTIASTALPATASDKREVPENAVGMLYDTTLCIGCKACVVACHEANDLPPDNRERELHDAPTALNDRTKNIIKLYSEEGEEAFIKQQCMHCVDPGCVGACMIGALQKREFGIVTWESDRCIGCRYCQIACPYNVPKFEWDDPTPRIVKCELCNHRLAQGQIPACCDVCPREAVIFGTRKELLAEAKRRLKESPDKYVPKVFGETDGGGTQVLYLSHIPFEKLGFPELGETGVPSLNRQIQHGVYKGMIAPAALYAVLGGVMLRNRKTDKDDDGGES